MGAAASERPDREPPSAGPAADITDPLKEIRRLKRWIQVGVYGAIYAAVPCYYFFLDASRFNLFLGMGLITMVATLSIELGFRRIMSLSKRNAYPRLTIVYMYGIEAAAAPFRLALDLSVRLLNVRAAFIVLRDDHNEPAVAASVGLNRQEADRLLHLGLLHVYQVMQTGIPAIFRPTFPLLGDSTLRRGEILIFVPIATLETPLGVLALVGHRHKADLRDFTLLRDMGLALGLSLENLRQKEELREMAIVDELTQVYNRRYFFEQLEREMAEARRYNSPLAILLLDFDDLKVINDRYGHSAGDEALRTVARCFVRHSRTTDIVARLGGDEFALVLPRSSYEGAREMAHRLCQAVASQPLLLPDGTVVPMDVSYGIAAFPDDAQDIEPLLRQADAHMYETKRARRQVRA